MSNPFNHPAWIDISLFLARLVLGLYMLLAGWAKISGGLYEFVKNQVHPLKPSWLPDQVTYGYGFALPVLELVTGLLLVLGLFTRLAAGVMTVVLPSIAIALFGRYGITGLEKAGPPFQHAIVFATLAFLLSIVGSGRLALDPLYSGGGGKK